MDIGKLYLQTLKFVKQINLLTGSLFYKFQKSFFIVEVYNTKSNIDVH